MSDLNPGECCYEGRRHAQETGETPSSHPGPCTFNRLREATEAAAKGIAKTLLERELARIKSMSPADGVRAFGLVEKATGRTLSEAEVEQVAKRMENTRACSCCGVLRKDLDAGAKHDHGCMNVEDE